VAFSFAGEQRDLVRRIAKAFEKELCQTLAEHEANPLSVDGDSIFPRRTGLNTPME
jgi:hypothetical protein